MGKLLLEATKDLRKLAGNQQLLVAKAMERVRQNPWPISEGGYGKPLGNEKGNDLTDILKTKLKSVGIRVVYKSMRTETEILSVVISGREDDEVYDVV